MAVNGLGAEWHKQGIERWITAIGFVLFMGFVDSEKTRRSCLSPFIHSDGDADKYTQDHLCFSCCVRIFQILQLHSVQELIWICFHSIYIERNSEKLVFLSDSNMGEEAKLCKKCSYFSFYMANFTVILSEYTPILKTSI